MVVEYFKYGIKLREVFLSKEMKETLEKELGPLITLVSFSDSEESSVRLHTPVGYLYVRVNENKTI